ncbi:MAG: NifU family protein [Endomicrobium sp.]|jgi:Fe-S cluster biogenesis protein NfuA|nr:NifU family protein [Endomicrobium sp.]
MTTKQKVEQALNNIRIHLKADGGDVELVDVNCQEGIVKVKLIGTCKKCPMSNLTMQYSITKTIKEFAPEIKKVQTV